MLLVVLPHRYHRHHHWDKLSSTPWRGETVKRAKQDFKNALQGIEIPGRMQELLAQNDDNVEDAQQ